MRPAAEIIILDGLITVYKNSADVWLYVVSRVALRLAGPIHVARAACCPHT